MRLSLLFSILLLLMSTPILAKVRGVSSPRLDAMGGAGAGSILMDEATILNPAPLAFFGKTSFYYQKSSGAVSEYNGAVNAPEPEFKTYAVTDAKGGVKGGVRYSYLSEFGFSRKEIAVAYGQPIAQKSAFGMSYHKITEKMSGTELEEYNRGDIGVIHAISKEFTLGIVIQDLFKKHKEENITVVGFQWVYMGFITLNLDAGFNYNYDINDTFLYRTGVQVMFWQDLYLRAGYFDDKNTFSRGTGVGVSWLTPRFKFELAVKNTTFTKNIEFYNQSMKLKETSFAVSYYY